jgi:two-component system, LytTR family, response regulator
MRRLKCIIVDDEPLALDILQDYIEKVPFLEFNGRFENAIEALNYLKVNETDLLLLDIQMEELTGIQLLKILTDKPQVILTTAYASYALEGYELDVTDYLLKPISFERFLLAVTKAWERKQSTLEVKEIMDTGMMVANPRTDYFFVKTEYRLQKINFSDILFIEGQSDYLKIVLKEENIMTLQNFKRMEEVLPEGYFVRIHRSYIIALDKIEKVEKNRVSINGNELPIGDSYREEFYRVLGSKGII